MIRVALPTEGVDRNRFSARKSLFPCTVALPTEGVDRNLQIGDDERERMGSPSPRRAWIEIDKADFTLWDEQTSPSPRRAWIEIAFYAVADLISNVALPTEGVDRNKETLRACLLAGVALPTEGVDRNSSLASIPAVNLASPSPRRAWIEISATLMPRAPAAVALPAEGVDRNTARQR